MNTDDLQIFGNIDKADDFINSLNSGTFLFSMTMSYTATCEIPGISIAGADVDSFKFTPPADAEYLHYGYCKTINGIPITPDGKPTPALLTKAALEYSSIPHMIINAGSRALPNLPFIETGLSSGNNIYYDNAMSLQQVTRAVDYGRIVGRNLASLADCLVIGESIPGGTTTAMAVLHGLGFPVRVSSSMPNNPLKLKEQVVNDALNRIAPIVVDSNPDMKKSIKTKKDSQSVCIDDDYNAQHDDNFKSAPKSDFDPAQKIQHLYDVVACVGDPMIPFVAGMLSSASMSSKVMLAGGTQMAAVLAFASGIEFNDENVAVGTTTYVANDPNADFASMISRIADVPAIAVDPKLENSKHPGLKAFASGYAKEGVGAGGCMISAMLKSSISCADLVGLIDAEYERLFSSAATTNTI